MSNSVHKIERSPNYGRYEYLLQTPHLQEFLTDLEARHSDEDYQIWTRQGIQPHRPGVHISRVEFNRPAILNKNAYLSVTQLKYLSSLSNKELMAKHGRQLVHYHFKVIEDYRRMHAPKPLPEKPEPSPTPPAKNEPPQSKPIVEKVPLPETKPLQKPKIASSPPLVKTPPPAIKATPKAAPAPKTRQEPKRFLWQKTQHTKETVDNRQTDLSEPESANDRKSKACPGLTVRHRKVNIPQIKEKVYLHRKKILVTLGLNVLVFAGIHFELNDDDEPAATVAAETVNWTPPVKTLSETSVEINSPVFPHGLWDTLSIPSLDPYLMPPASFVESGSQLFDDANDLSVDDLSVEENLAILTPEPDVVTLDDAAVEVQNGLLENEQQIASISSEEAIDLLEEQIMEYQVAVSVIDEEDIPLQADISSQLPPEAVNIEEAQVPEVELNLPIILVNQLTVEQQLEAQVTVEEVEPVVAPAPTTPKPEITSSNLTATLTEEQKGWLIAANISESDWPYVDYIMTKESNWSPFLQNQQGSSAYGLCQRLMSVHPLKAGETYMEDPVAQLIWCDNYAHRRYGSWKKSYEAWKKKHWW